MKQIILRGPRLTLRPISLADAPIFARWFRDKEVVKYLKHQMPITLRDEKKWIKKILKGKDQVVWTIINETAKVIGNTALRLDKKNKRGSLGIIIGEKNQWGKGYAGECIRLLADFLFKRLKFNRFELDVYMKSKRALKAYRKAGFVLEGVRRQYRQNRITGQLEDEGIMSILRREYLKTSHK